MQPVPITGDQWTSISATLLWLWVGVGCAIVAAGLLLAGGALAPSLAATGQLPSWARNLRRPALTLGVLALAAAVAAFALAAWRAGALYDIYDKVWI
jgi:hypothetical protein